LAQAQDAEMVEENTRIVKEAGARGVVGLVPRIIPLVGLISAPLLLASDTAIMFGLSEQFSLPAGIATLSVA